jgi:hypothetical protein
VRENGVDPELGVRPFFEGNARREVAEEVKPSPIDRSTDATILSWPAKIPDSTSLEEEPPTMRLQDLSPICTPIEIVTRSKVANWLGLDGLSGFGFIEDAGELPEVSLLGSRDGSDGGGTTADQDIFIPCWMRSAARWSND